MKRALMLAACLALLPTARAFGAGLNLFWNGCGIDPGSTTNRNFACDTNTGVNMMVASFDPPAGITQLVASRAVIDLESADSSLPSWWHLAAGGCREGSLSLSFTATSECLDYWSGAAVQELSYSMGVGGNPDRARIVISFGKSEAEAGPVTPGTEYYAFSLIMDHAKSAGMGSCAGCDVPVCIILQELTLYQAPGLGDYRVCNPLLSNFVTWHGGAIGGSGCPPAEHSYPCTTPTLNRTWGQMKGIYR